LAIALSLNSKLSYIGFKSTDYKKHKNKIAYDFNINRLFTYDSEGILRGLFNYNINGNNSIDWVPLLNKK
jgi:hypothetical protein